MNLTLAILTGALATFAACATAAAWWLKTQAREFRLTTMRLRAKVAELNSRP